jgi:hypothetical protein
LTAPSVSNSSRYSTDASFPTHDQGTIIPSTNFCSSSTSIGTTGIGLGPDWLHKSHRLESLVKANESSQPGKLQVLFPDVLLQITSKLHIIFVQIPQMHFGADVEAIYEGPNLIYRSSAGIDKIRNAVHDFGSCSDGSDVFRGAKRCRVVDMNETIRSPVVTKIGDAVADLPASHSLYIVTSAGEVRTVASFCI